MRYDKVIYLCFESTSRRYNPSLGRYDEVENLKIQKYAHINKMSKKREREVFGEVDSETTIARIQGMYTPKVSFVLIDGIKYNIIERNYTRHDTAFYLREVI